MLAEDLRLLYDFGQAWLTQHDTGPSSQQQSHCKVEWVQSIFCQDDWQGQGRT